MRTVGTFQDIYDQAKAYTLDEERCDVMDPEVRYDGNLWMIESSLDQEIDVQAKCKLEVFCEYFYESFRDGDYAPGKLCEDDFLDMLVG